MMFLLTVGRWLLATCATLAVSLPAAAFIYSSEKVQVRFVDRETGKPAKSVIGVAIWEVEHPSFVTGRVYRPVAIEEAVSDADGWIEFPAWQTERSFEAGYTSSAPRILLYHEDYRPIFLVNEVTMEPQASQPARSRWNGKEVALEKKSTDIKKQLGDLVSIYSRLPDTQEDPENPCWFEKFPRMLAALDRMDTRYRESSILVATTSRSLRHSEAFLVSKGCRKVTEVIAEGGKK